MNKNTLRNYRAMELEVEQLKELIARVETRLTEPKTSKLSHTAKGKGATADTIGGGVAWMESLLSLYEKKVERLSNALREIEGAIDGLESKERLLMRYRYIEGLKWDEIAEKLGRSRRQIDRLHGEILLKLKKQQPE